MSQKRKKSFITKAQSTKTRKKYNISCFPNFVFLMVLARD